MIIISIFQLSIIQLSNIPIILDAAGHGLFANQIHFHAVFRAQSFTKTSELTEEETKNQIFTNNVYYPYISDIYVLTISNIYNI